MEMKYKRIFSKEYIKVSGELSSMEIISCCCALMILSNRFRRT